MLTAQEELEKFLDKPAKAFQKAMAWLARAIFRDRHDWDPAYVNLAQTFRETLILADMHGRKRLLMEADALARGHSAKYAAWNPPLAQSMEFKEALDDMVKREPRLASSAKEVSRLYNSGHVFALADSTSEKLTARVQQIIADAIKEGAGSLQTETEIINAALEASHVWTDSYAQSVFETNVTGAYARGRIAQAQDPDIREVIPALTVTGQDDARTRPNHRAYWGLIAAADDTIWMTATPPYGYRCRCALEHVSIYELESKGLIRNGQIVRYEPPGFQNAHKDGPPFS